MVNINVQLDSLAHIPRKVSKLDYMVTIEDVKMNNH